MGTDDLEQARGLDRLGEENHVRERLASQVFESGHHARHHDDGRGRHPGQAAQAFDELQAVHVRQDVVLEHEVWRVVAGEGEGGSTVSGFGDPKPFALEGEAHHLAGDRVVLDDEDRACVHVGLGGSVPER